MIECKDGLFHLSSPQLSCLLRVGRYGLLELLHFGPAVSAADAAALSCRPGLGWGGSLLLNDADSQSCPEVIPLAWSGSGRGDFRESPVELDGKSTDFCYVNHTIHETPPPMESGLPQASGGGETLEILMEQPGARLSLFFTLYETALVRRTVLHNTSDVPITIHKLMSACVDIPGAFEVTTFDGAWITEMGLHRTGVTRARVVNESTTGASSHYHNPGFLLSEAGATEDRGRVYGFNLIYSGNHYGSAQLSAQGLTRVLQGISPNHFAASLAPGERFETPEAVLTVSDGGFGGMSRNMHDFVKAHIIPEYWRGRPRPVLFNSWEGCMFDFTEKKLLSLAKSAKDLGCELFVLDDGWFGARNDDHAGLGDYTVNTKKLPHGLNGLGERINKIGLDFGLWFEPESVNEDSALYRAHPDWALTDRFPTITGRHQLLLDLTKPEVRNYIVNNVSRILDTAPICYVKWDMNRHSVALGEKAHHHVLGLYDVLRRIFGPRPQVLLESCSSGGNRFDLGMLCFSPQVWCSDNTDPISRLDIQEGLSYLYPQSTFGAHVSASPHAQTLRATPLSTRGNVSFFGLLGYELNLKHLKPLEIREIQRQIAFYKEHRLLFQYGAFRRTGTGWQVTRGGVTAAGVFHRLAVPAPGYEFLKVKGLDPKKTYRLRTRAQKLPLAQFGSLVNHISPVKLDPEGAVLHTADRFVELDNGAEGYSVSGAALTWGIPLLPLFRGTGYDRNQRTQGDFGSSLYIIEEEAP